MRLVVRLAQEMKMAVAPHLAARSHYRLHPAVAASIRVTLDFMWEHLRFREAERVPRKLGCLDAKTIEDHKLLD